MASRALPKQPAETAEPDRSALPLWDGTQLSGLSWLRELEANEHLLDADVSYLLRTAAVVSSAAKTAVSSPEHSALLKHNLSTTSSSSRITRFVTHLQTMDLLAFTQIFKPKLLPRRLPSLVKR